MERRGDVELVHDAGATVGEGPVWDARTGTLVWVDIAGRVVHRFDHDRGTDDPFPVPLDVGAIVPRRSGGFVLALQDGFWLMGDGEEPRPWAPVEADDPGTRFNDGKCDRAGRFWAGTMGYTEHAGRGTLYRLDADGTVTAHVRDIAIANGLAWTADGRTMYYIDSLTRRVDAFDVDPGAGTLGGRRPVLTFTPEEGLPDGMSIDSEGALWVAFFGGSNASRYDPRTGECLMRIDLPATNITSCAFGGPDLDWLYITSAREDLAPPGSGTSPGSGGLFRIRPGVRGLAPDLFRG